MADAWPELETPGYLDTVTTLHRWAQIVGKTRLALEPMVNHWWQVPLYVTACGLATPVLHAGDRSFEIELDLVTHALRVRDESGRTAGFELAPMTVAEFDLRHRAALASLGLAVRIWGRPVELADATPFAEDEVHRSYDRAWARSFATVLRKVDAIFDAFRGAYLGKASPVHFFWGGFDLAVTRFSGRRAPRHPGGVPNLADRVTIEAYSHEVSSAGLWPGDPTYPMVMFYSYAYPEPEGFARARVRPPAARWDATLREHVLPYEAVRGAADPDAEVRAFLESTYAAAADLGRWDRRALERAEEPR